MSRDKSLRNTVLSFSKMSLTDCPCFQYHSQPVVDYNVAFANAPLQPPLTVNFTWKWNHFWGGIGLVFRAHGTADFYEVSFPAIGRSPSAAKWCGCWSRASAPPRDGGR